MTTPAPHDPTSRVQPIDDTDGTAPPAAPHELPSGVDAGDRRFEAEGRTWIARVTGKGASGTGAYGLGMIEAVTFYDARTPDRPLREALLARGRFDGLFERELAELLAKATPVVLPDER